MSPVATVCFLMWEPVGRGTDIYLRMTETSCPYRSMTMMALILFPQPSDTVFCHEEKEKHQSYTNRVFLFFLWMCQMVNYSNVTIRKRILAMCLHTAHTVWVLLRCSIDSYQDRWCVNSLSYLNTSFNALLSHLIYSEKGKGNHNWEKI